MFAYLKLNKYLEESFHAKVDLVREFTENLEKVYAMAKAFEN